MNSPLILNTELFFTLVTILMTFKSPAVKQIYLQIFRKTKGILIQNHFLWENIMYVLLLKQTTYFWYNILTNKNSRVNIKFPKSNDFSLRIQGKG